MKLQKAEHWIPSIIMGWLFLKYLTFSICFQSWMMKNLFQAQLTNCKRWSLTNLVLDIISIRIISDKNSQILLGKLFDHHCDHLYSLRGLTSRIVNFRTSQVGFLYSGWAYIQVHSIFCLIVESLWNLLKIYLLPSNSLLRSRCSKGSLLGLSQCFVGMILHC